MHLVHLTIRNFRSRPGRALLTVLSIVLGVAAVVSVLMASQATRRAFAELFETLSGRASLHIVASAGGGFDQSVVDDVRQVRGVAWAVPVVQRQTILYFAGRRAQVLAQGIDPQLDAHLRDYRLTEGRWFADAAAESPDEGDGGDGSANEPQGIVLEASFARQLGLHAGDEVKMLVRRGLVRLPVQGIVAAEKAGPFNQGLVFLPIPTAQQLFHMRGQVSTIYLVLEAVEQEQSVASAIRQRLPVGLRVEPPPARSTLAEETLFAAQAGLNLASSLAVVVAGFIIMNTLFMTVSERRRQFAILRAIGATRSQITWLILREALIIGIVGTSFGLAVGIVGASVLADVIGRLFQATLPAPQVTLPIALLGSAVGLGVTLISCFLPVRVAARASPLEGLRGTAASSARRFRWQVPALGAVLLLAATAILVGSVLGFVPFWLTIPGTLSLLVSLVCMLPLFFGPLTRWVGAALYPLLGFAATLAERQLLRHRWRSVLTVGVLFVAMATGLGMGLTVLNDSQDVNHWFDRSLGGDFFVRAMMPDMGTGLAADLPDEVSDQVRRLPGIAAIRTARFVPGQADGERVVVVVREFRPADPLYLDLKQGEPEEVRRGLSEGAVVIGTVLAHRLNKNVGDGIEMETLRGLQELSIVGLANDYASGGMAVYMQSGVAERLLGVGGTDLLVVQAEPNQLAAVQSALDAICREYGLLLQSYADLKSLVLRIKNGIVGSLWGLLVMGFVVAAFGIANTLTMNVLEQTRELGLLRVVAMTRGQLRRMILSQSILMGTIGLVPGLAVGIIMAWTTNLSTRSVFGHSAEFFLHPWLLLGVLASAFLIVLAAAWLPAVRASRLSLLEALRQE